MGKVRAPANLKRVLESTCKVAAQDLSKLAPGEKNKKRLAEKLTTGVCKDVDQKILKLVASELAKFAKGKNAKVPPGVGPAKIKGVPAFKEPGHGVPSFSIPLYDLDVGSGNKAKFELMVWVDPQDFDNKDKGGAVSFKVVF